MTDPTWNWVFKNTFDAMEEQLNKVVMSTNPYTCNTDAKYLSSFVLFMFWYFHGATSHSDMSLFHPFSDSPNIFPQVLFAVAALVILVRFISNLASGPKTFPTISNTDYCETTLL